MLKEKQTKRPIVLKKRFLFGTYWTKQTVSDYSIFASSKSGGNIEAENSILKDFTSSATKQMTRMHGTTEGGQTVSTTTPTNTSNIKDGDLKLPDIFEDIPSRYGSLKDRLEFKLIASGNLKRSINEKDKNHHIFRAVRSFFFDLDEVISSPKNIRHIRLVAAVNENESIKEHFGDARFATTIKSILHKLIPLANSKQF